MIQKCDIYLYSGLPIEDEQNRIIEGMADFLSFYSPIVKYGYNMFKNEFETELVFQNNDLNVANFETDDISKFKSNNYNYVKIVPTVVYAGGTETSYAEPLYYFVKEVKWTAEKVVRLSMKLDVLNTFAVGSGYTFGEKSHIVRQHKSRFNITSKSKTSTFTLDGDGQATVTYTQDDNIAYVRDLFVVAEHTATPSVVYNGKSVTIFVEGTANDYCVLTCKLILAKPVLDRYSEGINPVLFKSKETTISDKAENIGWNLIYRNKNDIDASKPQNVNPVDCLLMPDQPVNVEYFSTDIHGADLNVDFFYLISAPINGGFEFSIEDDGTVVCVINHTPSQWVWAESVDRWVYIYQDAGDVHVVSVYQMNYIIPGGHYVQVKDHGTFSAIQFVGANPVKYNHGEWADYPGLGDRTKLPGKASGVDYGVYAPTTWDGEPSKFAGTTATDILRDVSSLDRTDNRLIKIIKVPYCPDTFDTSGSALVIPSTWEYTSAGSLLTLKELSKVFYREFDARNAETGSKIKNPLEVITKTPVEPKVSTARNDIFELKIYHSDYYRPKLVYDSFGMEILPEQMEPDAVDPNTFKIAFAVTSTINSKFLFMLPEYRNNLLFTTEDYPGVLPVSRNNDGVLFNSQYINYIRNGYNYDLKNKTRQEIAAGLGIVGNVAAAGAGVATGNALGVMMAGAGAVQNVQSIVAAEQAIEQKIAQSKMQAVSVSGSDDVDLLEVYSGNRAKLCIYEVSPRVKAAMLDIFYYFGYTEDEYGVPTMNCRYWFDYVQGDMKIKPVQHLNARIMDELRGKYAAGVTVFHKHGSGASSTWNIDQNKENWEKEFIE